MFVECPRCHGMMDHDVCEYCGCFDPTFRARVTPEGVAPQEPAPAAQPNVIVNNYITQPAPEQQYQSEQPVTGGRYDFVSASLDREMNRISRKKKWTAVLLCALGGVFGVHRFYVGKNKSGLLYLCTMGLCGYGVLFDLVWIAIGKFKDVYGYPLKQ